MTGAPDGLVDLRCPGIGKLLGRARPVLYADGVIELVCGNCATAMRRGGTPVLRVLHRFNLLGALLETEAVTADEVPTRAGAPAITPQGRHQ